MCYTIQVCSVSEDRICCQHTWVSGLRARNPHGLHCGDWLRFLRIGPTGLFRSAHTGRGFTGDGAAAWTLVLTPNTSTLPGRRAEDIAGGQNMEHTGEASVGAQGHATHTWWRALLAIIAEDQRGSDFFGFVGQPTMVGA